jgi:hypothetical protein
MLEQQNNGESLCTHFPTRITRVTWLLNASAWLQEDEHCTATWRDIQNQFINGIAMEHDQRIQQQQGTTVSGHVVLAFDLAALLPLHVPLPANVSPDEDFLLDELNNNNSHVIGRIMDTISGRAMEACPLHHWKWLKHLGEHLQCPPRFTQLEVARCLVLPNLTAERYATLVAETREWLGKSYNASILAGLQADDYFIELLAHRIVAQQLVANPFYCKSLLIFGPNNNRNDPVEAHVPLDVSQLTLPSATRQPMASEAFAQLLPHFVNALTNNTSADTRAVVLVCPGPDTLARILVAMALAHKKSSSSSSSTLLPQHRCFLKIDGTPWLLDVGHFYNYIYTLWSKSHQQQRPWQGVITWALAALFSKEDESLATLLWNMQPTLFTAVGLDNGFVAQWFFRAWQLRLVPKSDMRTPCPLAMLHAAQANNIEIPDFEKLDALVARVYSDPVDRIPLVYEKPLPFMLFGFHLQHKERLKYVLKKAEGAEYYALLATLGMAKRRFYINMLHAENTFMLTCWTLDIL